MCEPGSVRSVSCLRNHLVAAALAVLVVATAGCSQQPDTAATPGGGPANSTPSSAVSSEKPSGQPDDNPHSNSNESQTATDSPTKQPAAAITQMVLAISVDGLNPDALVSLGDELAPHFWEMVSQGASTLNARTEFEQTVTLPNHAGMLTGRRIGANDGGHGYTSDSDNGGRITGPGEEPVASVFDTVAAAGMSSALFASKTKFELYNRTWPSIDRYVCNEDNAGLVDTAASDLVHAHRAFTFLHLSLPDKAGHAYGWGSPEYLRAVADVDVLLGALLDTIDDTPRLRRHLVLILTADHGGVGDEHFNPTRAADYTIPFMVRGPGVPNGVDLYDLNPRRRDPGDRRGGYTGPQPIRNADVADLAMSLLGLGPVPQSQVGASDPLVVLR